MIGKPISALATPALLIDADVVERNLQKAAQIARETGKKLRPHIKTHKIPQIALRQIALGASGICVAKVSEAEVMAQAGIEDILIANQVIGRDKLDRLAALACERQISVLVDSAEGIQALSDAAQRYRATIQVLVEIDTGDGRCGVAPEQVIPLVREILKRPGLRFKGIETFGGSVYHCAGPEEELVLSKELAKTMARVKADLEAAGIGVEEVTVGGSPAMNLLAQEDLYTELRPGVYVFNDAATVSRGAAAYEDCAATVLTTVISRPTAHRMVVDGGGKTFSYCRPGVVFGHRILHGVVKGNESICLSNLSEEHGVFETEADLSDYHIGDRIQVIPAHVCPVINLFDQAYWVKDGIVQAIVPIAARGKTE